MDYTRLICHRIPERSFFFRGHQFPVCARCTGFYISLAIYFIYAYFNYVDYDLNLLILAIILLVPAFLDGTTQLFQFRQSNNILRLITGLLGGIGLGILVKSLKYYIFIYFAIIQALKVLNYPYMIFTGFRLVLIFFLKVLNYYILILFVLVLFVFTVHPLVQNVKEKESRRLCRNPLLVKR